MVTPKRILATVLRAACFRRKRQRHLRWVGDSTESGQCTQTHGNLLAKAALLITTDGLP